MAAWRRFFLRLRNVFLTQAAERDLSREIASHLALLEGEFLRRGHGAEEARRAAVRALGGVECTKDLHRAERSFGWLADAWQDLQYSVRTLKRSPGFAVVVIGMMALAIGATTTLFSLAYGVLAKPLPWSEAERLVRVEERRGGSRGRIPWTITNAPTSPGAPTTRPSKRLVAGCGASR